MSDGSDQGRAAGARRETETGVPRDWRVARGSVEAHHRGGEDCGRSGLQVVTASPEACGRERAGVHYFETTSDAFFANETTFLKQRGIDVALIDGLHTYQQVVRDVTNTLRYLRDDGVIVLHDCNPTRPSVAFPAASYADFRARNHWWHTMWSGDVWKAMVDLRSTRHDLRIAVLDCDYGVGIIRTGVPDSALSYSADQIAALNYSDLSLDRDRLLNLQPSSYLDQFLATPRADLR